jgi:hypothetical protein
MGRAKTLKPAIQDRPATFSSIVSKGSLTVGGTVTISGSLTLSGSEDLVVNTITASGNISSSGTTHTKFIRLPGVGDSSAAQGSIYFGLGPDETNGFIYGQSSSNLTLGFDTVNTVRINDRGIDVDGNITASNQGNISASGDIFANTGSLRHITNIDEIRKDADTFIKFEDSKLTLNSFGTTANSILEIGSLAGDEAFVVKADNVRFNSYGNNPFIHCLHSINSTKFFQNITSSGIFSSSNEIIGNALTISSNEINFTNLPTSDPGVVGRLYRDGATVKISI